MYIMYRWITDKKITTENRSIDSNPPALIGQYRLTEKIKGK